MTSDGREAVELRVHGVGGAHGAKMLGYESLADDVVVVERGKDTRILARSRDSSVESYDWGDLTSGSGLRSLWIVLLPFTLMNVAGWMHPPVDQSSPGTVRWIRRLVHFLSLMLTAIYVITLGVIVVDLIGWQWSRRLALPDNEAGYPVALESTLGTTRWVSTAALIVVAVLIGGLRLLAGRSQLRFERKEPAAELRAGLTGEEPWGDDERLTSRGFFFHPDAASRLLFRHTVVAGLSFAVVAGLTVWRAWLHPRKLDESLKIYEALTLPTVFVIASIFVLAFLSRRSPRSAGHPWVSGGPAIAATLAFAVLNAVSAGIHVLLILVLNVLPPRPEAAERLRAGPEVNAVDLWGVVSIVLVLAGLTLYVLARHRRPPDDLPPRTTPVDLPPDGADEAVRKAVAKSRFIALLARRSGRMAQGLAAALLLSYTVLVLYRIIRADGIFLPAPRDLTSPLYVIGSGVLLLVVAVLVLMVRQSFGGAQTLASTLWDVLTFWPRRFSPLAVRAYSEQAIPELQGRIVHHVRGDDRPRALVLSAHSQGSILGFAALDSLPDDDLRHVAFVTYGSPISTIYTTFFPACFGGDEVGQLRSRVPSPGTGLVGWKNFYRQTDPIGGPAFGESDPADQELADPFPGTAADPDPSTPPRERDRPPWTQVAGHSHYHAEPVLKRWVAAVRSALTQA